MNKSNFLKQISEAKKEFEELSLKDNEFVNEVVIRYVDFILNEIKKYGDLTFPLKSGFSIRPDDLTESKLKAILSKFRELGLFVETVTCRSTGGTEVKLIGVDDDILRTLKPKTCNVHSTFNDPSGLGLNIDDYLYGIAINKSRLKL